MATLQKAIEIAVAAHAHQRNKSGGPYVLHPLRVMLSLRTEEERIVGVLHDVIEDTAVTLPDIRKAGFSDRVLEALQLVTHAKGQPYADYVVRCSRDPIAREVKLADLRDNGGLDRALCRPESLGRDLARIHRYVLSFKFLTGVIDEASYRLAMADHG
jgi:hypothetical protein